MLSLNKLILSHNITQYGLFAKSAVRNNSKPGGFFQKIIQNMQQEFNKDSEMKDNIKKFREGTEKLNNSEQLQKVRTYYKKIESEINVNDTSEKIKEQFSDIKREASKKFEEIGKTEYVQKTLSEVSKASSQLYETAKRVADTDVIKYAKSGVETISSELETDNSKIYKPPVILKTRNELAGKGEQRVFEANEEAMGMVIHKDSKWYISWSNFKDSNPYMQKFFDIKSKYDESENAIVRSSKFVIEKFTGALGYMFTNSELQEALTKIAQLDPNFSVEAFMKFVRFDLVPNVLEALAKGETEILKDWCHEAAFNLLTQPLAEFTKMGLRRDLRILDVSHFELATAKVMEHGPVLVVTFRAQQVECFRNAKGDIVQGKADRVMLVNHVWALCRDLDEFNPWAGWKLLDIAMMSSDQFI